MKFILPEEVFLQEAFVSSGFLPGYSGSGTVPAVSGAPKTGLFFPSGWCRLG
jgi:hypothetical protein